MSDKKMLERLRTLDPRVMYFLTLLFVSIPIVHPIGLPINISPTTRAAYEIVEQLPPGSLVWFGIDFHPAHYPEVYAAMVVGMRHLFGKNVNIMFVSFSPTGPMWYAQAMAEIGPPPGKKYGTDYVFLGYLPGEETAIAALSSDVKGIAKTDYYGTPIDSIAFLRDVKTVKDFSLVYVFTGFAPIIDPYIRHIGGTYRVRIVAGLIAVQYAEKIVYYPHTIAGLLNGAKGGAEYEKLTGFIGAASSAMDAFSVAQGVLVALIIATNIVFLAGKARHRGDT